METLARGQSSVLAGAGGTKCWGGFIVGGRKGLRHVTCASSDAGCAVPASNRHRAMLPSAVCAPKE